MENEKCVFATLVVAANPDLMQIEDFFEQNYLFRNNVLNGRYEVTCVGQNPLVCHIRYIQRDSDILPTFFTKYEE